jgi:hypothetical protein
MARDGGEACQASLRPEDLWSVTDHTLAIMPQHGRACRGGCLEMGAGISVLSACADAACAARERDTPSQKES